jgi:hypothetical protein
MAATGTMHMNKELPVACFNKWREQETHWQDACRLPARLQGIKGADHVLHTVRREVPADKRQRPGMVWHTEMPAVFHTAAYEKS